jgi:hypothetical protein
MERRTGQGMGGGAGQGRSHVSTLPNLRVFVLERPVAIGASSLPSRSVQGRVHERSAERQT